MNLPRRLLTAAALVSATAVAAYALAAQAQPAPSQRIVGYAVYAHSQYVLLQTPGGDLRSCRINRQTTLNSSPQWECGGSLICRNARPDACV
jgi:hypothetical protein